MKNEIRSAEIRVEIECRRLNLNPNGIPAISPGLRGPSYPGSGEWNCANPNGVVSALSIRRCNPVGVEILSGHISQGSSSLATLGWMTQSLWDWRTSQWPSHSRSVLDCGDGVGEVTALASPALRPTPRRADIPVRSNAIRPRGVSKFSRVSMRKQLRTGMSARRGRPPSRFFQVKTATPQTPSPQSKTWRTCHTLSISCALKLYDH